MRAKINIILILLFTILFSTMGFAELMNVTKYNTTTFILEKGVVQQLFMGENKSFVNFTSITPNLTETWQIQIEERFVGKQNGTNISLNWKLDDYELVIFYNFNISNYVYPNVTIYRGDDNDLRLLFNDDTLNGNIMAVTLYFNVTEENKYDILNYSAIKANSSLDQYLLINSTNLPNGTINFTVNYSFCSDPLSGPPTNEPAYDYCPGNYLGNQYYDVSIEYLEEIDMYLNITSVELFPSILNSNQGISGNCSFISTSSSNHSIIYNLYKNNVKVLNGEIIVNGSGEYNLFNYSGEIYNDNFYLTCRVNNSLFDVNKPDFCFQEFANVSTECGGLSTGNYIIGGGWEISSIPYDGDYLNMISGDGGYLIANYTIPNVLNNAIWQVVQEGTGGVRVRHNLSISSSCLTESNLYVKAIGRSSLQQMEYYCYNGSEYISIGNKTSPNGAFIEEAIYWADFNYSTFSPIYFISTWNTSATSSGSSNTTQITLPIYNGGTYDFTVDWGDGNVSNVYTWDSVNKTHNYASAGIYTLTINGTISGFRFAGAGDKLKIYNITQWGDLNIINNYAFNGCENLNFTGTDNLNLTGATDLSFMFNGASIFNGNISGWNVSNITNMRAMFTDAYAFNQSLNNWDVSNVLDMYAMFQTALAFDQPLNNWNTTNVTTMGYMFAYTYNFSQDLSSWDVSKVTDMTYMFFRALSFNGNITNWNTASLLNTTQMFRNAIKFNQSLNGWNTSKLQDVQFMFSCDQFDFNCSVFNQDFDNWDTSNLVRTRYMFNGQEVFNGKVGNWNMSNVTDMSFMFNRAYKFNQEVNNWTFPKVTNLNGVFYNAIEFNQSVDKWNVSNITDISYLFAGAVNFNQDVSNWDVSKVKFMQWTFANSYCTILNSTTNPNISNWNVSNVQYMNYLFYCADSFNQNLSNWDTRNVLNLDSTLRQLKLFNGNITNWNTSNVTTLYATFARSPLFNQDISNWDVRNVNNMDATFSYTNFNQNISIWNTSNVNSMNSMFWNAKVFNYSLNNWDVSKVTNMQYMFRNATNADKNISNWNISAVTTMLLMFNETTIPTEIYDQILINWSTLPVQNNVIFDAGDSQYTSGALAARTVLTDTYNWTINDLGYKEPTINLSVVNDSTISQSVNYTFYNENIEQIDKCWYIVYTINGTRNGTPGECTGTFLLNASDGSVINLTAFMNDTSNNIVNSSRYNLTVSYTTGTYEFNIPYANNTYTNNNTLTWGFNTTDPDYNIAVYSYEIGGSATTVITSNKSYSIPLFDGIYTYSVAAYDIYDNYFYIDANVTIDTTKPYVIYNSNTTANGTYKQNNSIYISYNVTDINFNISILNLYNSSLDVVNTTNVTSNSTVDINFTELPDGVYYYNVTATDLAGNYNITNTYQVTIISAFRSDLYIFNFPLENNSYSNNSIVTYGFTTTDINYNHTIYRLNSSEFYTTNNSITYDLSDGNYNYSLQLFDKANNSYLVDQNVTIDTVNPIISFNANSTANDSISSNTFIYLSLNTSDTNLNYTILNLYNGSLSLLNTTNITESGTLSINVTELINGTYYFNAIAYDLAGNVVETGNYITFIRDGFDNESYSVTFPYENNVYTTNSTLTYGFTTTDILYNYTTYYIEHANMSEKLIMMENRSFQITDEALAFDGDYDTNMTSDNKKTGIYEMNYTGISASFAKWELVYSNNTVKTYYNFTVPTNCMNDKIWLKITLYESAFNTNTRHIFQCYNYSSSSFYTFEDVQSVGGDDGDNNIVYESTLYLGNASYTTTNQSISLDLNDGKYYYALTIYDKANNSQYYDPNVTIDTINPVLLFNANTTANGTYKQNNSIYISYNVTDVNLNISILNLYNSSLDLVNTTNVTSSSTVDINFTNLPDGVYYYNVTATDLAGNYNDTDTYQVTIISTFKNETYAVTFPYINEEYTNNSTLTYGFTTTDVNYNYTIYHLDSVNYTTENQSISFVLSDGKYYYALTIYDKAGNSYYYDPNITIDTVNPSIEYMSDTISDLTSSTTITDMRITVNASDINFNYSMINVYNSSSELIYTANTTSNGTVLNITYNFTNNGVYYFNATAVDYAGNVNNTATRQVTINTYKNNITFTGYQRTTNATIPYEIYLMQNQNENYTLANNGTYAFSNPTNVFDNNNLTFANASGATLNFGPVIGKLFDENIHVYDIYYAFNGTSADGGTNGYQVFLESFDGTTWNSVSTLYSNTANASAINTLNRDGTYNLNASTNGIRLRFAVTSSSSPVIKTANVSELRINSTRGLIVYNYSTAGPTYELNNLLSNDTFNVVLNASGYYLCYVANNWTAQSNYVFPACGLYNSIVNSYAHNSYTNTSISNYSVTIKLGGHQDTVTVNGTTAGLPLIQSEAYSLDFSKTGYLSTLDTAYTPSGTWESLNRSMNETRINLIFRNRFTNETMNGTVIGINDTSYAGKNWSTDTGSFEFNPNSGVHVIRFNSSSYVDYSITYDFAGAEVGTYYVYMYPLINTTIYEEKQSMTTLTLFNLSHPTTISWTVNCLGEDGSPIGTETQIIPNTTTGSFLINATCAYEIIKFNLNYVQIDGTQESYYRVLFLENINESFNANVFLPDLTLGYDILPTPLKPYDIFGIYTTDKNTKVYVTKIMPTGTEQITADYVDAEGKITAYLIAGETYIITIKADGAPIRVLGPYTADTADTKILRLFDVTLVSNLTSFGKNVLVSTDLVNSTVNSTMVVMHFKDNGNVTQNATLLFYNGSCSSKGTLLINSTNSFTGNDTINEVYVSYSVLGSRYNNGTEDIQFCAVYEAYDMAGKYTVLEDNVRYDTYKLFPATFGDEWTLSWVLIFLLVIISLGLNARTVSIGSLIVTGLAMLFYSINWFSVGSIGAGAGVAITTALLIAILFNIKKIMGY